MFRAALELSSAVALMQSTQRPVLQIRPPVHPLRPYWRQSKNMTLLQLQMPIQSHQSLIHKRSSSKFDSHPSAARRFNNAGFIFTRSRIIW
ncbi:hypothetical protein BCR44DRAFT_1249062 [Catenaria anguillulae PL171]|uniref:Uncharacterized protein n=1 Tax=Catenaria anguillulae PL171 TaxID=765915 RepID=A0A1Y2I280_9FUNG|nr:hypothetical protein BCR44DRAFT_1249062 [Catenaria anguillulae PL171]